VARLTADTRRQEFIEAAVKVISEHGVGGATTRRIAEVADAPLASIHYCFHTKKELLIAVFQHLAELLVERVVVPEETAGLGRTASSLLSATIEWYLENDASTRAQLDLYLWMLRQGNEQSGLAEQSYRAVEDRFTELLRRHMGPDDNEQLIEPVVRIVISLADGLILGWLGDHDDAKLKTTLALANRSVEFAATPDSRTVTT
jgi:AcrR family transcriptional regulator